MAGIKFGLDNGEIWCQGAGHLAPILETWELWLAMLGP